MNNRVRPQCGFVGCRLPHRAHGLCAGHYSQLRSGTELRPLAPRHGRIALVDRFWSKVDKTEACWLWTGSIDVCGYGRIGVAGANKKAPRVARELTNGPIPIGDGAHGICVLHRCDNRRCVRPDHLFLGTNADNIADKLAKGRHVATRGEKHPLAKLTLDAVLLIRATASRRGEKARLARIYGVNQTTIRHVITRATWRHV